MSIRDAYARATASSSALLLHTFTKPCLAPRAKCGFVGLLLWGLLDFILEFKFLNDPVDVIESTFFDCDPLLCVGLGCKKHELDS